jgi:hypothetical protein
MGTEPVNTAGHPGPGLPVKAYALLTCHFLNRNFLRCPAFGLEIPSSRALG